MRSSCGSVLWFLWLWVASRGDTDVSCVFMQSCVLPCSFQSSGPVHIHWIQLRGGQIPVLSFPGRLDRPGLQDRRFRGRSSLFREQISRGNASLLLTAVKVQDEGRYECFTEGRGANGHCVINLTVDAPVGDLRVEHVGDRISCSSEGIYPNPEHRWSLRASSNAGVQSAIRVRRTEEQLHDINSSLTLSHGASFLVYSCSFSTRRSRRRVTLFRTVSVSVPEAGATIRCSARNLTVTRLVWRFNHSLVLLIRNGSGGEQRVSEGWRRHVKGVAASGSLTLQDLSSQQEGLYTCELSSTEEAVISGTMLTIDRNHGPSWILAAALGPLAAVALLTLTAALLVARFKKR